MIKPTVGRVLWYYPRGATQVDQELQPFAATVAHVINDGKVNIGFLDSYGEHGCAHNVRLLQDDEPAPAEPFCMWMPFQKGQAPASDAVKAELEALKKRVRDLEVAKGG